jgi:putative PIG3 family NAD(P)H quinone oxidoreductase
MRAIAIEGGHGEADALKLVEAPRPELKPGHILIAVKAAGVNRPDVLQRRGLYPPPPGAPDTLGLEVAGEVVEAAPDAPRWKVGDKVTALLGGGGYAEFAAVDARHALPIPAGLDFIQAAALPETVFTVFTNVFERGRLVAGETLMLHGATSGIGVTAIEMAKAAGARVIATSRGQAKADRARALGADIALDSDAVDWVKAITDAGGCDVVLDMVGGDFIAKNLACLNLEGRHVSISLQAGWAAEIDFRPVMGRRLTITGSTLRARPAEEKARLAMAVETTVWPWIAAGKVVPLIDHVYPLAEAAEAHRRMESNDHMGKIVLTT